MPYFPPQPKSIYINYEGAPEGNIILSDDGYWAYGNVYLDVIYVKTLSTDWDMYLCRNSLFDIASIDTIRLVSSGLGDTVVPVNITYDSFDGNIYLVYVDNSGSATASFSVVGRTL